MRLRLAAVLAAALAAPALAQETYAIDPDHTVPTFAIGHLGISVQRGQFSKTTGKIEIDRAAKKGSVEATVDTTTVSSGSPRRDALLKSEDYFDIAKYPTATFKSTKLVFDGDDLVAADGELTLRGVTKPVALKVANFRCLPAQANARTRCGADVSTVVKLTDFGFRKPNALTDDVQIAFGIEAVGGGM